MIWSPVIEDDFGQERFLTAHPVHCLLNDDFVKVPVMSGLTTDEAGWKAFCTLHLTNNAHSYMLYKLTMLILCSRYIK